MTRHPAGWCQTHPSFPMDFAWHEWAPGLSLLALMGPISSDQGYRPSALPPGIHPNLGFRRHVTPHFPFFTSPGLTIVFLHAFIWYKEKSSLFLCFNYARIVSLWWWWRACCLVKGQAPASSLKTGVSQVPPKCLKLWSSDLPPQ